MNILKSNIQLLKALENVTITEIRSSADAEHFSHEYQFSPDQILFTPSALSMMKTSTESDILYYFQDLFLLSILVFRLNESFFILGPFSTVILDKIDAERLLKANNITNITTTDLLLYHNSFPKITKERAIQIAQALRSATEPDADAFEIRDRSEDSFSVRTEIESERSQYIKLLERRYEYEQDYMSAIREGNTKEALDNYQKMQQDVAYLKRIGTTLENERFGAAVLRTTTRMAAIQAGLAPVVIDRLSSKNTVASRNAKTIEAIIATKEELIRDFCKAIQDYRNSSYSALVLGVIYYLNHNYPEYFTLGDMAEELGLSKSYMITRFKAETGTTPLEYLTTLRMKKAANLLLGTTRSIQDISSMVGIPDSNYFVKLFKKHYQLTPRDYRKQRKV